MRYRSIHIPFFVCSAEPRAATDWFKFQTEMEKQSISPFDSNSNEMGTIVNCEQSSGLNIYEWINGNGYWSIESIGVHHSHRRKLKWNEKEKEKYIDVYLMYGKPHGPRNSCEPIRAMFMARVWIENGKQTLDLYILCSCKHLSPIIMVALRVDGLLVRRSLQRQRRAAFVWLAASNAIGIRVPDCKELSTTTPTIFRRHK